MIADNPLEKRSYVISEAVALVSAAGLLLLFLAFWGTELLHAERHLLVALAITAGFSLGAWLAHGVSVSGTLAGAVIALVMAGRELKMFWVLLVVFSVTLAATRVGSARKRELRVAESKSGRSASQVMANLGLAALLVAAPSVSSWQLLALAALAEVAADTTSSEIGAAFTGATVLITTWKPVPPGTDGGISLRGTAAGISATVIVAACAAWLNLTSIAGAAIIVGAAAGGMLIDSLLGALLERRGFLNNDVVNLLGTGVAAVIALLATL